MSRPKRWRLPRAYLDAALAYRRIVAAGYIAGPGVRDGEIALRCRPRLRGPFGPGPWLVRSFENLDAAAAWAAANPRARR